MKLPSIIVLAIAASAIAAAPSTRPTTAPGVGESAVGAGKVVVCFLIDESLSTVGRTFNAQLSTFNIEAKKKTRYGFES